MSPDVIPFVQKHHVLLAQALYSHETVSGTYPDQRRRSGYIHHVGPPPMKPLSTQTLCFLPVGVGDWSVTVMAGWVSLGHWFQNFLTGQFQTAHARLCTCCSLTIDISFQKFSRQLSVFSFCSSGLASALLVLSTIHLFMKVLLQPWYNP